MKTILTLTAIIFLGTFGVAQTSTKEVKVETITKSVVLNVEIKQIIKEDNKVARLYMFKNSRIKKELAFKTKRNRSKLA
ncbi:hypothetical protein MTsPCn9_01330 [Croceitalea sp. MTPC9]|uniref:hypothetical protein n=1 Tax=unclassified Croceitalea TaxID=2632280 RepID=UPI002B3BA98D|nr:hypothetical protein MTsPCn6_07380 [Croceitalea sp. MTPC6]GMN15197.1 hypothetical protein MTsPCn9_01330 [Croceitalea sp. MTPC9]